MVEQHTKPHAGLILNHNPKKKHLWIYKHWEKSAADLFAMHFKFEAIFFSVTHFITRQISLEQIFWIESSLHCCRGTITLRRASSNQRDPPSLSRSYLYPLLIPKPISASIFSHRTPLSSARKIHFYSFPTAFLSISFRLDHSPTKAQGLSIMCNSKGPSQVISERCAGESHAKFKISASCSITLDSIWEEAPAITDWLAIWRTGSLWDWFIYSFMTPMVP